MANDYFHFKKFTIRQDKCAMKVGTDGVLLGAWTSVTNCKTILDVGTGTGLIALMLAQRSKAQIDAIDIEQDAFVQASENVAASPFYEQIKICHQSFDDFTLIPDHTYDLIVCNPPFFFKSLNSPDNKRNIARHTEGFSYMDLIEKGKSLLNPKGRISLIIPFEQGKELVNFILNQQMSIIRQTDVYPTASSSPKRILVELSKDQSTPCLRDRLVIEESRHKYTLDFQLLTKDFYL